MKRNSIIATVLGLLVAVANAWVTIDWDHFEFNTGNCMKLSLSAVIAIGGAVSSVNMPKKKAKDEVRN